MKKIIMATILLFSVLLINTGDASAATKEKSIKISDTDFSKKYKSSKMEAVNTFKIKMPSMGKYTYTDTMPVVIINLKTKKGVTVKTWTVKGEDKMKGGTYTYKGLQEYEYYVQVTGNIKQKKAATWKYTYTKPKKL